MSSKQEQPPHRPRYHAWPEQCTVLKVAVATISPFLQVPGRTSSLHNIWNSASEQGPRHQLDTSRCASRINRSFVLQCFDESLSLAFVGR
ncbi:unnamed protein product [Symbiodinium necroappetens]|uniref:Uncharacterized protein n=1 Tax=Symbiodinium necroappetens TaxID=1628268 RepID=A0A812ZZ06_9DINO|nr:unnamed protein product [Symbiodinium necroappetens]